MISFLFFILSALLFWAGVGCLNLQRKFSRWSVDRELDRLAGALWALSLVSYALGVSYFLE